MCGTGAAVCGTEHEHAPVPDRQLGRKPIVAEATDTVQETIILAGKLHIPVLNMHLSQGVYFTLPHRRVYLFEEYLQQYLRSIRLFRDKCEKMVGTGDVRICVENSSGYTAFQRQALTILLESPVFGLTRWQTLSLSFPRCAVRKRPSPPGNGRN